ncbi:PR-1-like protein, partial [Metschnikowia bicuspidata]
KNEVLNTHNEKRALHGVDPLKWSTSLAQFAADYAASDFRCENAELIHSDGSYGENLALGYVGGHEPVRAWYDEIKAYNWSNPGFSMKTAHFTQVIWKDTKEVGCAYVTCPNEWRQYTICEYDPPGNWEDEDEYRENVLRRV